VQVPPVREGDVSERKPIGTVTDAMEKYNMDAADVWAHIVHGFFLASGDHLVRLEADPDKRFGPQGTTWLVEEVEV
jgi:hypothetical protein